MWPLKIDTPENPYPWQMIKHQPGTDPPQPLLEVVGRAPVFPPADPTPGRYDAPMANSVALACLAACAIDDGYLRGAAVAR